MTGPGTQTSILLAGTGNAFGDGHRAQACIHIRNNHLNGNLLLDCGATSLSALKGHDTEPNDVTTILVSHLHGDHFGGIPYLILDGQFRHRKTDLQIVGPTGTQQRLRSAMETLYPGSYETRRRFSVHVTELPAGQSTEVGVMRVDATAVIHDAGDPALAYRVTIGDHAIAYSGDTEWTDDLLPLADDTDVFICEAYTVNRPVRGHMHLPHLDRNKNRLAAARTLLVHPSLDVLSDPNATDRLATDGMVVDL